jgi:predicted membrane protein
MDTVHPMDILSLVTALVYIGTVFYFRSRKSERRNVLKVVIDACREIGILTVVLYNLAAVAIILLIREPQSYVAHGFIASIDITDLNLFLWVILLLDFFGLSLRVKLDFLDTLHHPIRDNSEVVVVPDNGLYGQRYCGVCYCQFSLPDFCYFGLDVGAKMIFGRVF